MILGSYIWMRTDYNNYPIDYWILWLKTGLPLLPISE